jgi:hypothetical protein
LIDDIGSLGKQATAHDKNAEGIDSRQIVPSRQLDDQFDLARIAQAERTHLHSELRGHSLARRLRPTDEEHTYPAGPVERVVSIAWNTIETSDVDSEAKVDMVQHMLSVPAHWSHKEHQVEQPNESARDSQ